MSEQIYTGLSQQEVEERIQKGFVNKVTVSTEKTTWQIIQSNVFTYFNFIFFVLALLLIIVQSWNNLLFLPIVIINSLIGIVQELRARKILSNMQLLHHYTAIAVRDGKEIQLETKDLVQDDIVLFSTGDQIYADAKIVSGELKVNESQLTGEADEIAKQISDTVMSGSFVVSGKAYARLEKVGDESYINQLTLKAKEVSGKEESEMVRSVNNLVKVIGFLIIPLGLLLFFQSYVTNHESFQVSIVSTVGAIIGMIPEGLYLLMTLALALGAASLARQQVLLNSMKGIESLSRVDVLCVDKTGTITENTMKVAQVLSVQQDNNASQEALKQYLAASPDENETIAAIRDFFVSEVVEKAWTVVKTFPFSSKTKFGAISFKEGNFILGAPEFVLKEKLEEYRSYFQQYVESGSRVLVFAESKDQPFTGDLTQTVEPLLFILLENPIRENAADTFSYFDVQGVEVKVISGDNPVTVAAVAAKAEIPHAENYVDAQNLDTDEKITQAVEKYTVFGRVTPQQKQKLVQALQANQHKVAMTGDGVNDAPALKTADIGIGMGITGTEVSKGASDMILADDNFATIIVAVEEGRKVFSNIQKTIQYLLSANTAEVLTIFLATLFGWDVLQPVHLLWINLVTDTFPAIALGVESAEPGVMTHKPRGRKSSFFSGGVMSSIIYQGLLQGALVLGVYAYALMNPVHVGDMRAIHADALTMSFATLGLIQLFHAFNVKSVYQSLLTVGPFKSKTFNWSILVSFILLASTILVEPLEGIFHVTKLDLSQWAAVLIGSFSMIIIVEIVKFVQRKLGMDKNAI